MFQVSYSLNFFFNYVFPCPSRAPTPSVSLAATTFFELCELVKSGFQYVTGEYSDGGKIFRKTK